MPGSFDFAAILRGFAFTELSLRLFMFGWNFLLDWF